MTLKPFFAVTFVICSLAVQGAGIQADHIVTQIEADRERVEIGQWIQDEFGRIRINIDDWTQIQDPIEGIVWRANSKSGRYSESRSRLPTMPMGSPLIDIPGSLSSDDSREVSRIDLGTRVINDVECKGTLVEIVVSGRGFNKKFELEAWLTEAFVFPFNVLFIVRDDNGEQRTELRNIVEMTDRQVEGVFKPDSDWRKSRFPIVRINKEWTGVWPFTNPGSKVTGLPVSLACVSRTRRHHGRRSYQAVSLIAEQVVHISGEEKLTSEAVLFDLDDTIIDFPIFSATRTALSSKFGSSTFKRIA